MDEAAAAELSRAGGQPSAIHNNCSGKHTGFLATALHLGEETRGYVKPGHPVQERMVEVLSEMGSHDLTDAPRAATLRHPRHRHAASRHGLRSGPAGQPR